MEEIKAAQKMRFNLLTMANQLLKKKPFNEPMRKQKFDEHPLVVAYREQLIEANDLVQHVTALIQYRVNEELEGRELNATKTKIHP